MTDYWKIRKPTSEFFWIMFAIFSLIATVVFVFLDMILWSIVSIIMFNMSILNVETRDLQKRLEDLENE